MANTLDSAFVICDKIGRIWATRFLCVLWAAGIAIFMAGGVNGSLAAIYAGRFIAGLGVGQTPVVGYVAEAHLRTCKSNSSQSYLYR